MPFKKAQKEKIKARVILSGASNGGTTMSALILARGIVGPSGRIAVLDTEHGTAKLYSSLGDYDVDEMNAPFTTGKFISVIELAEHLNYDLLIIDTISRAWAGEGGITEQVGKYASNGNKNGAWDLVMPNHYELVRKIVNSSIHIVCTLKCKTDYLAGEANGRTFPKRISLAPIQREGFEDNFNVAFDLDPVSHVAFCTKDHSGLFDGFAEVLTEQHGEQLRAWLDDGVEVDQTAAEPNEQAGKQAEASQSAGATAMFVNATQVEELKSLLTETGTDLKGFLNYFKVDKLENLPAKNFATAVSGLKAKKEKGATSQETPAGSSAQTRDSIVEALKARNISFTEEGGVILATTKYTDTAAKQLLKELEFKWDSGLRRWKYAA